jgi:hypothetical protein
MVRYRVGNKNDYLTLEESARMLGKPNSFLKSLMSEGKLSARLAGGSWWISIRDLEELRENLQAEREIVHNYLSAKSEKPHQPSTFKRSSRGQPDKKTRLSKDRVAPVDGQNTAIAKESRKQRRIKELERRISEMKPALEKIFRKRQKMISQGRVPTINKPSLKLLRECRKLQNELDRLQGQPRWDKHLKRKSTSKKPEKPNKKGRNVQGTRGYFAEPGQFGEKRYWFNEE